MAEIYVDLFETQTLSFDGLPGFTGDLITRTRYRLKALFHVGVTNVLGFTDYLMRRVLVRLLKLYICREIVHRYDDSFKKKNIPLSVEDSV